MSVKAYFAELAALSTVLLSVQISGETLYNGIVLPDEWPLTRSGLLEMLQGTQMGILLVEDRIIMGCETSI